MNLTPLWVEYLATAGLKSRHWSAIGKPSAPDSEIFEYASRNDYVVLTHELDFGTLLASRKTRRPSVVQIRAQDILPATIGSLVVRTLIDTVAHLDAGALVTIDPARNRIRLLPIQS